MATGIVSRRGVSVPINGIVEQYKVAAGQTINVGDFVEFVNEWEAANSKVIESRWITSFSAQMVAFPNGNVLVVHNGGSFGGLFGLIATVNGGTVVGVGNKQISNLRHAASSFNLALLPNGKVLIVFGADNPTLRTPYAALINVDGVDIAMSEPVRLSDETYSGLYVDVKMISDNKALAIYGDRGNATIITVNDLEIKGEEPIPLMISTSYIFRNMILLSPTKAFLTFAYKQGNSDGRIYGAIATINSTEIELGELVQITTLTNSARNHSISRLPNGNVFLAFGYQQANAYLAATVVTINGTEIIPGENVEISATKNTGNYVKTLSLVSGNILIASGNNYTVCSVAEVDGTTITLGTSSGSTSAYEGIVGVVELADNTVLLVNKYASGSSYSVNGTVISIDGINASKGSTATLTGTFYPGGGIGAALLSNNTVFVVYGTGYTPELQWIYGVVITTDGAEVTIGDPIQLAATSAAANKISVVPLLDGNVFVTYSVSTSLYGIRATVDNDKIEVGEPLLLKTVTSSGYGCKIVPLLDGNIFAMYHASALYGMIITIHDTGISISESIKLTATAYSGTLLSLTPLSNGRLLSVFSAGSYLYGMIINIDGAEIIPSTPVQLNALLHSTSAFSVSMLQGGDVFVAFSSKEYLSSGTLCGMVLAVNGTEITPGVPVQLSEATYSGVVIGTQTLEDRNVLIIHRKGGSSTSSSMACLEVYATRSEIVVVDVDAQIADNGSESISMFLLPENNVFAVWKYSFSTSPAGHSFFSTTLQEIPVATPSTNCGLARTKGTSGATINVTRAIREDDTEDPEEAEG